MCKGTTFPLNQQENHGKNFQIEIYLVGTGSRCVGDGFHHINSLIIYYGISGALIIAQNTGIDTKNI